MAMAVGVSKDTVQRVWKDNGLQPHRTKSFKVSNDPHFVEKLVDVVGLYLDPPDHALVLSCDEKSQIQALDRTQKSLPIYPGRLMSFGAPKPATHRRPKPATMWVVLGGRIVLFGCVGKGRGQVVAV